MFFAWVALGHLSTIWSIFIWKMSWVILVQSAYIEVIPAKVCIKCCKKGNLICKMNTPNPFLASNLEYVVEPASLSDLFNVAAL